MASFSRKLRTTKLDRHGIVGIGAGAETVVAGTVVLGTVVSGTVTLGVATLATSTLGTVTAVGVVTVGVVTAGVVTAIVSWVRDSVVGDRSGGGVRGCGPPLFGGAGFGDAGLGAPERAGGVEAAAVTTTPRRPARAAVRARTRSADRRGGAAFPRTRSRTDLVVATSRKVVRSRETGNAAAASAVESDA
jgi:hypothetical protein